ncbi:hypothetical protein KQX54_010090 [Cotesia glomerata]|uniref:Uncharacterized protein n=1 Tax=Cotesia glomerata TaxID=32391 RepID=A0AAV7IEA3_COTGL|nr:hypothetical protein KQX54_010090 [Cotesia glomerata]
MNTPQNVSISGFTERFKRHGHHCQSFLRISRRRSEFRYTVASGWRPEQTGNSAICERGIGAEKWRPVGGKGTARKIGERRETSS